MRHCFRSTVLTSLLLAALSLPLSSQTIWHPPVFLPFVPTLNGVTIPDESTVVAVGNRGTIIRSSDGGHTWNLQESGVADVSENDLRGVSFGSASTGIASGGNPIILNTTDGGITWNRQQNGVPSQLRLQRPFMVDESFGVIAAVDPMLLTRDGGTTWESFFFPKGWAAKEDPAAYAFWMFDTSNGCALASVGHGFNGVVMQSQGTMYDWEITSSDTFYPLLLGITFADRLHGVVAGDAGTILRTTDGGATWSGVQSGTTALLYDVAFADAMHGVAVGNEGTIIATEDGGTTWRPQWSDTSYSFHGVAYRNGVAVAVGHDGSGRGVVLRRVDPSGSVAMTSASSGVRLEEPIPNPAMDEVMVRYALAHRRQVRVSVVDGRGREVMVIHDGVMPEGSYRHDVDVSSLASGLYGVRLQTDEGVIGRLFTVVR